MDEIKILAPIKPGKVICIGLNYKEHAKEFNIPIPKYPVFFFKPTSAIIGPMDNICIPDLSKQVEYEGELAIVIGKKCKNISKEDALDAIYGYTCANDVTARDIQQEDKSFSKAKCFDTFLPIGPAIETNLDYENLVITTFLNGKKVQDSPVTDMIRPVPVLISYLSQFMSLEPGDLVLTGSPPGTSPMKAGDNISINIEGIGTLKNQVIKM